MLVMLDTFHLRGNVSLAATSRRVMLSRLQSLSWKSLPSIYARELRDEMTRLATEGVSHWQIMIYASEGVVERLTAAERRQERDRWRECSRLA